MNLLRYAPRLNKFHLPTCIEKNRFTGKFTLEPGHRKLFFDQRCHLYLPCLLNLSGVELRVQQVQHRRNFVFPFATCSSAAPILPILCTFVGGSPSSAPCVGIRVSGTLLGIHGFADLARVLATMLPARLNCFLVLSQNRLQLLLTAAGKLPPERLGASLTTDQVLVA